MLSLSSHKQREPLGKFWSFGPGRKKIYILMVLVAASVLLVRYYNKIPQNNRKSLFSYFYFWLIFRP